MPRNEICAGDVIEVTVDGEVRTAEVMLISDDGTALLDLFDGDRPAFVHVTHLASAAVYRPEPADLVAAA